MGVVILVIVGILVIPFLLSLNKDSEDLGEYSSAMEKFQYITEVFERYYNQSSVSVIDKRTWVLKGTQGSYQRISFEFTYGAGNLNIIYSYPIYPKMKQHSDCIYNIRETSKWEQIVKAEKILEIFSNKFSVDMPSIMLAEQQRTSEILGHNRFRK